jgi:thiol-disulfide isomerase/thioredoxin
MVKLILMKSNTCPHCIKFFPTFDKVVDKMKTDNESKDINIFKYGETYLEQNYDKEIEILKKSGKVNTVPQLILFDGDNWDFIDISEHDENKILNNIKIKLKELKGLNFKIKYYKYKSKYLLIKNNNIYK